MTVAEQYNIAESFIIEDLDTLKKLTHPQRVEILHSLTQPRTVKEIAERIDADPTKLYYHIRQLEQIEVIQVVETNIVSGIVEKKYLVTAKEYKVGKGLFSGNEGDASDEDITNMFGAILSSTLTQAKRAAKAGLLDMKEIGETHSTSIMSGIFSLTDAQLDVFTERIQALFEEFKTLSEQNDETDESVKEFHHTFVFFPRPPSEFN